ncbi:probable UDP-sugar transporter protein SLC35A4 [Narcine bancroftii]|uniref:probable UDP-sugar transporter protein SLC35A4 n=1 Tax=Narcine bancroftii TaxID=1343680 RepID=UPI0038319912
MLAQEDPGVLGLQATRGRMRGRVCWALALLLSVLAYGSHAPLITLCKVGGRVPFASSSVVLLVEVAKLCASTSHLLGWDRSALAAAVSLHAALPYALPAALYALNNNLAVHMQSLMDPTTFQVLGNLKVVATAVFRGLLLRQPLPPRRWMALLLLMAAGACHAGAVRHAQEEPLALARPFITPLGLVSITVYCSVSGLSAAYTERVLKSQPLPLSLQNLFLYAFGVAVNLVLYLASSSTANLLEGYSLWVGVIILTQALNGLLMSAVLKYDSSITRLFLISCSMLVNAGLSVTLFDLELTPFFFAAVGLICMAIHLYYHVR